MRLIEIEHCLQVEWDDEVNAIVDTWFSYSVSKEEFSEAILQTALDHAVSKRSTDWIVDSHKAVGQLPESVHDLIKHQVIPSFAKVGIKRFFSITSKESVLTRMTIMRYTELLESHDIKVFEFDDLPAVKKWIKENPHIQSVTP